MRMEHKPIFWSMQPTYGAALSLTLEDMGRPQKHAELTGVASILARNILLRLPGAFPSATNQTGQIKLLAKKSGVAAETIRRILKGEVSPRLDNLEAIARAFGTSVSVMTAPLAGHDTVRLVSLEKVKRLA
jgi:transcriptional regulator with XRE-family HTH domain